MIKDQVVAFLREKIGQPVTLLTPKDMSFGDYAINVHQTGNLNLDAGNSKFIETLSQSELFEKVEQVGSFINLTINRKLLFEELNLILSEPEQYGKLSKKNNTIIFEFAHPNTHKLFHIGHLRNISTGESLSRILTAFGTRVIRVNYQGDVGLHIAKCLYGIQQRMDELKNLKTLDEKIAFLGKTYTEGTNAYDDEKAKEKINIINRQIFEMDPEIKPLWEETRAWSLEYYDLIYKRVGTKFDRLFFESEVADSGLAIAKDALQKGILTESEGAVVFDGSKYGIDTRVFINSLGLPTYEAKELGLAELEFSEFGTVNKCIHVVTPEQSSFFKVTFKVQELLNPQKYTDKQMHFAYEFVDLKGDKMSSRKGNVLTGEWLLDEVKERLKTTFSLDDEKAEILAIGAVKYAFLKVDAKRKILFSIEESISISGNSGPYIQYAYARCMSILKKVPPIEIATLSLVARNDELKNEELALVRTFFRFPEVIDAAATAYAPHLIATYLFDLTQKFSVFYEKCPIVKAESIELQAMRATLVAATGQILKNGLHLLGIEVLESI